jgi:hypothetical protein
LSFDRYITDHCNDDEVTTNIGELPLPKHQTSRGFFAFFEKISDEQPILTAFSNIREDVKYRCFKWVYDVKMMSKPDTMPLFANNS